MKNVFIVVLKHRKCLHKILSQCAWIFATTRIFLQCVSDHNYWPTCLRSHSIRTSFIISCLSFCTCAMLFINVAFLLLPINIFKPSLLLTDASRHQFVLITCNHRVSELNFAARRSTTYKRPLKYLFANTPLYPRKTLVRRCALPELWWTTILRNNMWWYRILPHALQK